MKFNFISIEFRRLLQAIFVVFPLICHINILSAQDSEIIRIGIHDNYPIIFYDKNDIPQGIIPDLIDKIAQEEQWNVEYVTGNWSVILNKVSNQQIDIVCGIAESESRILYLDYSKETIITLWGQLFLPNNSPVDSVFDLEGKSVGIVTDSIISENFISLINQFGVNVFYKEYMYLDDIFSNLDENHIDAGIGPNFFAGMNENNYQIEKSTIIFEPIHLLFATYKGGNQEILNTLDNYLIEWKQGEDSFYQQIMNYWLEDTFLKKEKIPDWIPRLVIILISIIFLWIGAFFILRIRSLKEKHRLQEQFFQSQKMESIGNLAGGIAHDFNNLLTVISGYSELILSSAGHIKKDELSESIKEILRAANNASLLTNQLLTFSRRQIVKLEEININVLIKDSVKMFRRLIGEDISLRIDLSKEMPFITADSGFLSQILMNLIVNSRDALPDGGEIEILTEVKNIESDYCKIHPKARPGQFVKLIVCDNGIGIDEKIQQSIFDPFFTTKEMGKGTGLGLSVVYGIVEQLDGWINLYSHPNEGTCFSLYFPVSNKKATNIPTNIIDKKLLLGANQLILLIEDDLAVSNYTVNILKKSGYNVVSASTGAQAKSKFAGLQNQVDMIICDVVLPDINGIDLIKTLMDIHPGLKVLFYSGYANIKSKKDIIDRDGFHFLHKPYTINELLSSVHETLTDSFNN